MTALTLMIKALIAAVTTISGSDAQVVSIRLCDGSADAGGNGAHAVVVVVVVVKPQHCPAPGGRQRRRDE